MTTIKVGVREFRERIASFPGIGHPSCCHSARRNSRCLRSDTSKAS
jgi:hypothetical protein